ncbi:xyloglucan endotransglucosylase/hydrolase protein 24-like [Cucurbita pepo subsp. pepo]|uniref:xyloglucan endotransglucosylase/hydrolase protein 24-like n=1 Tax=Cucurbita pepo subsp. pepo TaxID=3664 RepID=UPI000C9D9B2F|nr:xyloglucan endotransglucosylase/hydrolase protein 24-like [Cucurbita pepo subsp. pepo]
MAGASPPLCLVVLVVCLLGFSGAAADMNGELEITWGGDRAKFLDGGNELTLSLDKGSGSGFWSRNQYLFAKIDMQIKLVPGNSAGTVTAYYLRSEGSKWDEIDFEFLGNLSSEPYIVHTNIFIQGKGDREQQFYLWFDPTADFHTYSFLWNPKNIILYVDGTPIREFKNMESKGIPFPQKQALRLQSSLWNGDSWATWGGRVKIDWSQAPFTAAYTNFNDDQACIWSPSASSSCAASSKDDSWLSQQLDSAAHQKLEWVHKNYMIYNYCTDFKRFPLGLAPECGTQG